MTLRKSQKNLTQSKTPKNKSRHATTNSDIQTFTHHIRELRRRLFASILVGIVVGSLVYYYHDFFIKIVMEPIGSQKLIYLNPAGGFSFIFMVTFYVTLLIVLPFLLFQVYGFIKPAVPRHTRRLSLAVGIAAMILMATGATFGYLYAVPAGLNFLNNFASDYVTPSITADSYLSFILGYVLGIGALFELPLLLLFWHWIHPLTPKALLNSERYVILGAFVAAAMLSPSPDALSQAIIAVPIIVVYQLGVVVVLVSIRKARRSEKKAPVVHPGDTLSRQRISSGQTNDTLSRSKETSLSGGFPQTQSVSARRKNTSIDGMRVSASSFPDHRSKPHRTPPQSLRVVPPVRPQSTLTVTQRPHYISDIRPIRNSILDISR